MALFKISKGSASALSNQPKTEGYCWFTTDDGKFYIDVNSTTRQILNAGHADTATSADIANFATEAGTAATATKATQDGDGNVITSTYLPLTGGTLTGPLALTENIGYGTEIPATGIDGQIYFVAEDGGFSSLPEGGTSGQYLVKQSSEDGDATWQDFPIDITSLYNLINSKASTAAYSGTLTSSGWSSSAPYTQTITVNGILSTDTPFIDIDLSGSSSQSATIEAWGLVGRVTASAANSITAYCYEEKPTVDLPLVIKVVR